jgi:hypothetical protein
VSGFWFSGFADDCGYRPFLGIFMRWGQRFSDGIGENHYGWETC